MALALAGCSDLLHLDSYREGGLGSGLGGLSGLGGMGRAGSNSGTAGVSAAGGAVGSVGTRGGSALRRCGNGRIDQIGEQCDDGNQVNSDGCTNSCQVNCLAHPGQAPQTNTGSHCYSIFYDIVTFAQAHNNCQALGGDLATVTSLGESLWITAYQQMEVWIGATDGLRPEVLNARPYGWVNGEPWSLQLWKAGQPSATPNDCAGTPCYEHCAVATSAGDWNDVLCEAQRPYVCEWAPPGQKLLPFRPTAVSIGDTAVVHPEEYDFGGEGIAYHDGDDVILNPTYREGLVDIGNNAAEGWILSYFYPEEWLGFSVTVSGSGKYWVSLRAANGAASPATVHLEFGPVGQVGGSSVVVSPPITVAPTGSWSNFVNVFVPVQPALGQQWTRLVSDVGLTDIAAITFQSQSTVPERPFSFCALEGGTCVLDGTREVRFGADGSFITMNATGNVGCNISSFSGDPSPLQSKICEYR